MNLIKFITAAGICLSSVLYAQEVTNKTDASGKKQGHWIKLDENQKKIYEGNFENNIPVGLFTYYYDTGIPWSKSVFSKNGTVARTKMYDAGGNLIGEGKYVNEKKDSTWKFYGGEEFKLISEENYTGGIKNGSCKVFYANGQVSEEKIWKNGKLDGPCKKYFESGTMKYSGQYVADKLEGKVTYYQPNGKIDAQGVYKNDVKEGVWVYYQEDGVTVKRKDTYLAGRMVDSTDKGSDTITKEQMEKEKKNSEQYENKDFYDQNYHPEN
ncbi:MAG: toxin-antitoxin system YwqK family antitoxin [Bacteroidia bacterium]